MKIPRDVDGTKLVKALRVLGYERVRQGGSHIRLTTTINGPHHVTGTLLGGVLKPVAAHHRLTVEELLQQLGL